MSTFQGNAVCIHTSILCHIMYTYEYTLAAVKRAVIKSEKEREGGGRGGGERES